MKMLTGLMPASEGEAWLFGHEVNPHDIATRRRVGYMSQAFSLYGELTVQQNLVLHAQLFHVPPERNRRPRRRRCCSASACGERHAAARAACRWACASACRWPWPWCTSPELLILDEPTSGVDPVARDQFWRLLVELSRRDQVTIFISTHFMNEAERCDRMSMMHAGKVLDSDVPANLVDKRGAATLEEAFIGYLVEASGEAAPDLNTKNIAASADKTISFRQKPSETEQSPAQAAMVSQWRSHTPAFSLQRMWSYLSARRRWSCSATRCAPRWRWWARWC